MRRLLFILALFSILLPVPVGESQTLTGGTLKGGTLFGPTFPFITGQTLGTPRNNFAFGEGFAFTTSSSPPTVKYLCRWNISGNSGSHALYLDSFNGSTYVGIVTVTITMTAGFAGGYQCGSIAPTALSANTEYAVLSIESNGGDQFYDSNTAVTSIHSSFGSMVGAAYSNEVPPSTGTVFASGSFSYGPTNFEQ